VRRSALVLALAALAAPVGGAQAAAGPSATASPTVTGTLQQGNKLTALTGTWLGSGTITYAFQWYRCDANAAHCSSIHGATKSTYTEVAKDVGGTLGLTVRATDSTGTGEAYAPVAGLVASATAGNLVASAQPPLGGDPIVATPLAVQAATWSATPTTSTYAWLRCNANGRACAPIAGQTQATYTLTADDTGHTLVAAVTASAGGAKQTVLTLRSAVVRTAPGPVLTTAPVVTGTLQQGTKLTASAGTWSSGGTIAYAYQWYRCDPNGAHCSSIHGSTRSTYTTVAKDVGQTIGLTVRATDATGTTPAYAALAGLVAPAGAPLAASTQPKLDGTPTAGQTLKVEAPVWNGTAASATYAWLRCNANGRLCTKIAGEATDSYEVTAADAGHVLLAEVTGVAGTSQQSVLSLGASIAS
jgi:hypothetical protein